MYIRDDQRKELDTKTYGNAPFVKPQGETKWGLYISFRDKKGGTTLITSFETVTKANSALKSLRQAIEEDLGWDAIEYKSTSNREPIRMT